jgi:hypothetical protein
VIYSDFKFRFQIQCSIAPLQHVQPPTGGGAHSGHVHGGAQRARTVGRVADASHPPRNGDDFLRAAVRAARGAVLVARRGGSRADRAGHRRAVQKSRAGSRRDLTAHGGALHKLNAVDDP